MNAKHADLDRLRLWRLTPTWLLTFAVAGGATAWGIYAYSYWVTEGLITTGLRSVSQGGASWAFGKSLAVYFIGLSFGGACTAALIRLLGMDEARVVRRMAEVMTLVCLPLGALSIVADLGRPWEGILFLPQFAKPTSPLYGTFTMVVAVYLFANSVYVFLDGRADAAACAARYPRLAWAYRLWASGWRGTAIEKQRHDRASFWLSACLLPLEVTAMSTLGFVFGVQGGRPGWFSAVQAPSFIAIAASTGSAMLALILCTARRAARLDDVITEAALKAVARIVWLSTLLYVYIVVVELMTALYASNVADTEIAQAMIAGVYAPWFWASVACFVVPAALLLPVYLNGRVGTSALVIACLLLNLGGLVRRVLIIVPSQTHGLLLPFGVGYYAPNWSELSVGLGFAGLGVCLYLIAWKVFPLLPVVDIHPLEPAPVETDPRGARLLRAVATASMIVLGLGLTVAGFLLSARAGTLPFLDPIVPFSPMIFVLGIMFSLFSVAAYETIPPPRPSAPSPGNRVAAETT